MQGQALAKPSATTLKTARGGWTALKSTTHGWHARGHWSNAGSYGGHKKRKAAAVADYDSIKEFAGWITAALVGGAVGIQKLARFTTENRASMEHARADEALMKGLRTELERLGKQNGDLAETMNRLQIRIHDLQTEIGQLRANNLQQEREIMDLHSENFSLREEIANMHQQVIALRSVTIAKI
jgi:cell division protein FtsB